MENNLPFIQLNFYNDDDEITDTFEKNGVRWGILKKSLLLGKTMNVNEFTEEDYDKISAFVCEVFQNKFNTKDLEDKSNFDDVINVFKAVIKKANAMNINPN